MQKYGQHFLVNEGIINQIVDAALLLRAENLVEIGPGKGALTERLIARGQKNFTLVEIDPEMVSYLQTHLPKEADVKITRQNFLDFDLSLLPSVPTEFVSNLPYIDSADILDKVLGWPHFFSAVFMFQKEQALRIRAKAGEEFYGPLSVFSQLRARISPICKVGRGSFNPPPKVESAVLAFERLKEPVFSSEEVWKKFKKLVLSAFAHKRKTAFNSLALCGYPKDMVAEALAKLNLTPTVRAEQINPQTYVQLNKLVA
ncbi:MAG: 16S rRNA (adenine(1518)-N(6)/adenine(1519)-N(6))-dimethyltransferase RsmA [Elusimicrobia bacterium]|nr:16S rRNA (adenine(1518)-N(6)/adenine(1519)-N(6))-dimethyltransferase RsmA [Elusimicrobiota bacterium]MDD7578661.1 16S rRNA (adenine(1518)-N(6)/adenine(1519)-N(6))-dimethyltransferase RsmA [Elusimicrobiota bacterium]MDY6039305.1 16S rRNA (adenine(1518)-N(6)/adenine(1519)-N(6))-dimethyltransferase RsmA [Elusimicrobiaceae bacterium]